MKILLVILALFVGLVFTVPVYSAPYIYFNWQDTKTAETRIILLGLPDSPVECKFDQVANPDDSADQHYYKADYDIGQIPDGQYTITGKMREGIYESGESSPFPFVKKVPGMPMTIRLSL